MKAEFNVCTRQMDQRAQYIKRKRYFSKFTQKYSSLMAILNLLQEYILQCNKMQCQHITSRTSFNLIYLFKGLNLVDLLASTFKPYYFPIQLCTIFSLSYSRLLLLINIFIHNLTPPPPHPTEYTLFH